MCKTSSRKRLRNERGKLNLEFFKAVVLSRIFKPAQKKQALFVRFGALRAAQFVTAQRAGLYDMSHVLKGA